MIVLTQCARFISKNREMMLFLDLRRHQDESVQARGAHTLKFIVTRRIPGIQQYVNESFDTMPEAMRYWDTEARRLEDTGLIRDDLRIDGFHEEGRA